MSADEDHGLLLRPVFAYGCEDDWRSENALSGSYCQLANMMTAMTPVEPVLPTGTVTFLFTDIEGSTKLWETQRAAMQTALARHDALLRQAIERHHGHVVKTTGDGACAAFTSATEALEASVTAQQALDAEPWAGTVRICVRMALHSGPAEYRDGDYFGPTLNRLARLLALGHGGQTLVSGITCDLCRDYLPPNVSLERLGEYSLKDLDRRETVYEVRQAESPRNFPPLRTLFPPIDSDTPSIAVLAFADLSPKRDQEYFADGLAEELLNVLTKIRGLRVASRTSAFSFKGKDADISTMARKLNVATILEGSVRKSGKRVRVTVQLIQAATDSHIWSETYDRELKDIFAVQDDIAQSVVKGLRAALLGEKPNASANSVAKADVQAAAKGRGENADAYRRYLQGRFFEDRLTPADSAKAVDYYQQALDIDPAYALAWAGLSRAYVQQAEVSMANREGFHKAREAAERALQLAPDLAEGHAALGQIRMSHDLDWKGADASFRRAFELAPGSALVLKKAAVLAGNFGRLDEAIALLRRAAELDPLNVEAHQFLAGWCVRAGLLDEAEMSATKALELDPRHGVTRIWLGLVQMARGQSEQALRTFESEPDELHRLLGFALVHHACGRSAESDAALKGMIEKYAEGGAYQVALVYGYRGEANPAFEWLERAYLQRDTGLGAMKVSALLKHLHADPRWLPLLTKIGLAD